jgi:NAD+ kinase
VDAAGLTDARTEPFRLAGSDGLGPVGVLVTPLGECGPQLRAIEAWARELGLEMLELGTSADPTDTAAECALVIALGGDGTILRALQLAIPHSAPVLGVNFGTVGFLADVDRADLGAALDIIARGAAAVDSRTALVATMHGEPAYRAIAFNDVVISRLRGHGTARLEIEVGGQHLLALTGDGVVVASPTGSTAYTVGAGGPAVAPTLDAIVLTPLATQGSPLRSLVLDGSETVRVESREASAPLSLEVDGRAARELPTPAALEVGAAPGKARLVRTHPRTFYRDLANHL